VRITDTVVIGAGQAGLAASRLRPSPDMRGIAGR